MARAKTYSWAVTGAKLDKALNTMLDMSKALLPQVVKGRIEAGCDEAGRGAGGPVVAAAVVLDARVATQLLNDSKQLTASQRQQLRAEIEAKAITWSWLVSPSDIDRITSCKLV